MNPFDHSLDVRAHDDGEHWTVLQSVHFITRVGERIEIPAGYVTDFASVPRCLWAILPPTGRYLYAALIHDRLYGLHNRRRVECDRIFREAMAASRVPLWQRWVLWLGVRIGGGIAFAHCARKV